MIESRAADRLAALGHPARLRVLRALMAGGSAGVSAGTLAETAALAPNAATFHLNRLRLAGLVHRRRLGRETRYTADFAAVRALLDFLTATCCADADASDACGPVCTGPVPPAAPGDATEKTE